MWGGLFEPNYEFSPLEALDGVAEDPAEHYAYVQRQAFEIDPAKIDFVRQFGELRIGAGNPYLVFGTMLRPLDLDAAGVDLDWVNYNRPHGESFEPERGLNRVSEVFHAAWRAPEGAIGLFLINLHAPADGPLDISLPLVGLGDRTGSMVLATTTRSGGPPVQRWVAWRPVFTIDLPP